VLGPVTDRASATIPGWAGNGWVVWPLFAALTVLAAALAAADRRLAGSPDPAGPARAAALTSLRPPHIVRGRVQGRDAEIARLRTLLRDPGGRFAVVCAAGGMGKTTVAAAVAEQAARDGYAVYWIRWRGQETLADHMVQVALGCGLPQSAIDAAQSGRDNLTDAVWRRLGTAGRWLLVIDNADDPARIGPDGEHVADYRGWVRPYGRGLLLVTSRDGSPQTWGTAAEMVRLAPLDAAAGGRLLRDAAPAAGTGAEAEALAARLGGLPLALRAAGVSLGSPTARLRGFAPYRRALEAQLPALVGAESLLADDPDVARTVVRHTWELSLDQLAREGMPLARPLMRQLAHFAEAPVPLDLVTTALLATALHRPVTGSALDQALSGLERHGLLGAPEEDGPAMRDSGDGRRAAEDDEGGGPPPAVVLHPLIREITALAAVPPDDGDYGRAVVGALTAAVDRVAAEGLAGWPIARMLADHVPLLLDRPVFVPFADACAVIDRLADVLGDAGSYALQLGLRQAVLDRRGDALGADHPDTLTSRNHEANSLLSLGSYARSAELHRANLADRTRVLGPDHPDTLTSRSNLGFLLQHLGEYAQAVALHEQTLADRTRVLGPDHPQTLTSRENLANSHAGLGDHARAAALHERLIEDRTRVLGADHRRTLTSRADLAAALGGLGELRRALALHESVLADRARVLGPLHPYTLASRADVAESLRSLGEHAGAADLHERTLADRVRVLGPDHPHTRASRARLEACRADTAAGG
jgi:tetratricopeptide (TPR) repeat protein